MPEVNLHRFGYSGQRKEDDFRYRNSHAKKKYDAIEVHKNCQKLKKKAVNMKVVKLDLLKAWIGLGAWLVLKIFWVRNRSFLADKKNILCK